MNDSVSWNSISISPQGDKVAFWIVRQSIHCRGIVMNVSDHRVEAVVEGSLIPSPIGWSHEGRGAFAQPNRMEGRLTDWQLNIIAAPHYDIVKTFDIRTAVSSVHWLGEDKLGLVIPSESVDTADERDLYKFDLQILDVDTGEISSTLAVGNVSEPVAAVRDGEIWCQRNMPSGSTVYSVTGDRCVWSASRQRCLDSIVDIDHEGRFLLLHTHTNPLSVVWELMKFPRRAGCLLPALRRRIAVPTSMSLVDGVSGKQLWRTPSGQILNAAFGYDGTIGASVVLGRNSYGIAEYDTSSGLETIIEKYDSPVFVFGKAASGWISGKSERSVIVTGKSGTENLYPLTAAA
ncbi:MAG: hypothetical protein GX139_10185 [Armatimonadetes bacterium]|nr:hypothetical protein [Armatimonadota bacterium]